MSDADGIVCYCLRIRRSEVMRAWRSHDGDAASFMRQTRLGTVCTSCRSTLRGMCASSAAAAEPSTGPTQKLYSWHEPDLSPWKRLRRRLRVLRARLRGTRELRFFAAYRADDGWRTALHVSNLRHPAMRTSAVPVRTTVESFRQDGSLAETKTFTLAAGETRRVDVGAAGCGLSRMTVRPLWPWDALRLRVGSLRPYVTYETEGRAMTIHEKSLHFEHPRAVPGLVPAGGREIAVLMANIRDHEGWVDLVLRTDAGEERLRTALPPFGAHLATVPHDVDGAPVREVAMHSSVAFSGYQFTRRTGSPLVSVQHLVKEGS